MIPMRLSIFLLLLVAFLLSPGALADQRTELLEIKNTIVNLVDALVEQGILSEEKANQLKADAAAKARSDAKNATVVEAETDGEDGQTPAKAQNKVVRVPYVPEFVKDEIREQVREELRADVTKDVIATAKEERWGVKDALPQWVTAFAFSGDFRLRYEGNYFGADNLPSVNFQAINEAGGITPAGINVFRNVTDDRHRMRVRARLALDIGIVEQMGISMRLATGRLENPLSTNETLGQYGNQIEFLLDRAFVHWKEDRADGFNWLKLYGGRMPNPYFHASDLIWDPDLNFDGVAATLSQPLSFWGKVSGPAAPARRVFLTIGAFPLQENELSVEDGSSNDKWLWGAQAGIDWAFTKNSAATITFAYHDYINIVGRRNSFNSTLNDWTAPNLMIKGNTVFDIRNDLDVNTELFALAADFSLANLTAQYRYSGFDPFNIWITGDIVKNLGYNESSILRRTGVRVPERSLGYWVGAQVGNACETVRLNRTCTLAFGEWAFWGGYKYLQRDAVLDNFTDSNFHLGGTNAQGYVIGLDFGLTRNSWFRARYLSADEIDGPPLGIDVLQIDMNARF